MIDFQAFQREALGFHGIFDVRTEESRREFHGTVSLVKDEAVYSMGNILSKFDVGLNKIRV